MTEGNAQSVAVSDGDLLGYLDELLPADQAAKVEDALRDSTSLQHRAATLLRDRDDGTHSLADIWRRHRVACPSRNQLGTYLLGALDPDRAKYVSLHLNDLGCRYCLAERDDLIASRSDVDKSQRTQRFFESSVGRSLRDS